jgi:hypothetical protein
MHFSFYFYLWVSSSQDAQKNRSHQNRINRLHPMITLKEEKLTYDLYRPQIRWLKRR